MRRRGHGRIVNVSSVAGLLTFPGMGAYAMSKHALESMSQALRHELKPFGIGVSVIQPGGIDTPFAEAERRNVPSRPAEGPYGAFTAEVVEASEPQPDAVAGGQGRARDPASGHGSTSQGAVPASGPSRT